MDGRQEQHQRHGVGNTVSLVASVPEPLALALRQFIERHPHWDQYRLFQAALAGFLVQNGLGSRDVTRWYLANLFPAQQGFAGGSVTGSVTPLRRPQPGRYSDLDRAA